MRELFTFDFSSLFILLLGVTGMAGEWRHRTITSSVLAAPDRLRLLAAKLIAYAVAGTVLSLIVTVALMALGTLILSIRDETTLGLADLADVLWRNLAHRRAARRLRRLRRRDRAQPDRRHRRPAHLRVRARAGVAQPGARGRASSARRSAPRTGSSGSTPSTRASCSRRAVALLVMLGWVGLGFGVTAAMLQRRDLV